MTSNVRYMSCRGPRLRSRLLRTGERPVNGHKYATVMRQDLMNDKRAVTKLMAVVTRWPFKRSAAGAYMNTEFGTTT